MGVWLKISVENFCADNHIIVPAGTFHKFLTFLNNRFLITFVDHLQVSI